MPLRDGIQRFLDGIDPKILARGTDYYRSGQVEGIEWDGHHVTAEVSGSDVEPYLVEIGFTEDGEIADWSCDCPYDWGDVCKHTAAVLLFIQQETEESPPEKEKREKVSIQALVESAEKEQLAALDIAQFVLLTGVKLAGEADSSSGSLGWTIDAALETVELAADGLAESGGERMEWVKKLLKTVQDSMLDGWDHWRYPC